jgi:hypothetical protein
MRRLEAVGFAAIIALSATILVFCARPRAAQAVGNYLQDLAAPSLSDRGRLQLTLGEPQPVGKRTGLSSSMALQIRNL